MPPRGKQPASTSGHRFWVLIGHNLATPQIVIFRVLGDSGARMCTHRVNQQDYHAPVPWETTFRRQRPHYTGLWLSVPSRADAFRYIAFCLANYPALHGLRESGFRPEDAPIYDSLADVPHLIPLLVLQPDYQPRRWWPVLRGLGVNPVAELQRRGIEPAAPDSELEEAALVDYYVASCEDKCRTQIYGNNVTDEQRCLVFHPGYHAECIANCTAEATIACTLVNQSIDIAASCNTSCFSLRPKDVVTGGGGGGDAGGDVVESREFGSVILL